MANKGSWGKSGRGGLTNPQLPFMFEVAEIPNKPWQMLLPVNPENYKMTYQPRVNTTITQGGVFEDNIGLAPPKFSISGVFGVMGTFDPSAPQKSLSEHKNMVGLELYQEMEQNLLSFYERFGTYDMDDAENRNKVDTKKLPELNFYNFYDEEYWAVQINQFTLIRNTQRRHLYQYDIQMTGLKRVSEDKAPTPKAFTDAAQGKLDATAIAELAKKPTVWSKLLDAYKSTMQGVQYIQTLVGDLQRQMATISTAVANFTNGVTSLVHAPFDMVKLALATVNSIMASAKNLANLPHEFINDMRQMQRLLQGMVKQPQMFVAPPTASRVNVATRHALGMSADADATSLVRPAQAAVGTIKISMVTPATADITIPANTLVGTTAAPDNGGAVFKTTASVIIAAGQTTANIPIECTVVGTTGNVTSGAITSIVTAISGTPVLVVTNESAVTGGRETTTILIDTPVIPTQPQSPTGTEILTGPVTPAMQQAGATGMQIPEETIYDEGGIETPILVAASQISVLGNDTIQTIADRTGTDWKQIVSLNNLDYPFISSNPMDALSPSIASGIAPQIAEGASVFRIEGLSPSPGNILAFNSGNITLVVKSYDGWFITVTTSAPAGILIGSIVTVHEKQMTIAVPGQKLSIPGNSPAIGLVSGSSETFDEMLFGVDEMLDNSGLMPDYSTDIVVVAGSKNLAMQIYHRINTLKGELAQLGHPEYGSLVPTFIGKTMTPVWEERILLECKLAAGADPRVQYLDKARLYNKDSTLLFEADVYPINSRDPVIISIPIA